MFNGEEQLDGQVGAAVIAKFRFIAGVFGAVFFCVPEPVPIALFTDSGPLILAPP